MSQPNPAPEWLTDKVFKKYCDLSLEHVCMFVKHLTRSLVLQSWIEILQLSQSKNLKGFEQHFIENISHYKRIFDSSEAHQEPLPEDWNNKLNKLQKLLILRCIRVDKALLGIQVLTSLDSFVNLDSLV